MKLIMKHTPGLEGAGLQNMLKTFKLYITITLYKTNNSEL